MYTKYVPHLWVTLRKEGEDEQIGDHRRQPPYMKLIDAGGPEANTQLPT
jgi:hypothetical protein